MRLLIRIRFGRPAFTLVELLVVIAIIGVATGLTLAGVQMVRAAAARADCQNRLRQLALAAHQHHDARGHLPAGWTSEANWKTEYTDLGWPARLLPYLEQDARWRQVEDAFRTDPNRLGFYGLAPHATLLATPILAFACPADSRVSMAQQSGPVDARVSVAFTSYLGVDGRNGFQADGLLFADSQVRFAEVRDGASNTLLLGERPPANDYRLGWWYRGWGAGHDGVGEMILGVRERNFGTDYPECPSGPHQFAPGKADRPCDAFHFWSLHPGGANFAFADGSVRFLSYSANGTLPALATRAGGEGVSAAD